MALDLTRWNRAGLSRFRYVDGNAATYLDLLRRRMSALFQPRWTSLADAVPPAETDREHLERLEAQYQAAPNDVLLALGRAFARATHVLTEHLDAYANESYLGTATQWENVRRLVAMLDYHPSPPASAYTSLAITAKAGVAGTLPAGFQVKYAPPTGAPVVFETVEELALDAALNELRPSGYDRNPRTLSGTTLTLTEPLKGLKTGEPLVLEDERDGALRAYLIAGVAESDDAASVTVTVTPSLPTSFVSGYTRVHAVPQDRVAPRAPAATGAELGQSLQLDGPSADLQAGEVVILSVANEKPLYRSISYVEETRVVFHQAVGDLSLADAHLSRPVTLAVARHGRRTTADGTVLDIVYAAGDWSRLAGRWVADPRYVGGRRLLPLYQVMAAKYVTPTAEAATLEDDDKPGFTALTLRWSSAEDGVSGGGDLSPDNPQTLLVPPAAPGPWAPDTFLQKVDGHLPATLVTSQPKKTAAGDLAVVVQGNQLAWARLASVAVDLQHGEASLRAQGSWADRGGGPLYLSRTVVYAHYKAEARLKDWDVNPTPLTGTRVPLDEVPAALRAGRVVVARTDSDDGAVKTTVAAIDATTVPPSVVLADELPAGAAYGSLRLAANVVAAGHGETRAERVLGSGDATRLNQSFLLPVKEIAFVPDTSQSSGVRAAVDVAIAGANWTQVSNLRSSGPTDAHYTARVTEDGELEIAFGDGVNGRRLPTGTNNVRVTYRQGTGTGGNLDAGSLVKAVKPHRLVDTVEQPLPASGGADREDVSTLRTSAPATVLTLERAVSLQDFALLVRGHSSVAQARAFSQRTSAGRRESVEVVVVPAGGAAFTPELEATLEAFAAAGAPPGVDIAVSAYEPVPIGLVVTARVDSSVYAPATVEAAVKAALVAAFSLERRALGQPLYRGEVFQVVESTSGVANSDCGIIFEAADGAALAAQPRIVRGSDGSVRVMRPDDRQCIHLDPDQPAVTVTIEELTL